MTDKLSLNLSAFESFVTEKGWSKWGQKEIEHGYQVTVTDGIERLHVNFYNKGTILPQGKSGPMKAAVTEWANLRQSGIKAVPTSSHEIEPRQNRTAKYIVIPTLVEAIRDVIFTLPGNVVEKELSGSAEFYRAEIRDSSQRLMITQYTSGTLMIQGLSSQLFEDTCETLDRHLTQPFSDRAARYVPDEIALTTTSIYLKTPEAENEAAHWLFSKLDKHIYEFLYKNDQLTLLAAAGVRNAFQSAQALEDYSVVVMPFARAYEGFLIRLAIHLGLTSEDALSQKSKDIVVQTWLDAIKLRLTDRQRYLADAETINTAWLCRHKVVHSDHFLPKVMKSFGEADSEIDMFLRAMKRGYHVFVELNIKLSPAEVPQKEPAKKAAELPKEENRSEHENVDVESLRKKLEADGFTVRVLAENKRNIWEILDKHKLEVFAPRNPEGRLIIQGREANDFRNQYISLIEPKKALPQEKGAWIGVDEIISEE
ncbi:MAG: hypothetical protein J2P31_02635 [Blastocatellia bacterium]|nr:hypothetical protein [Blastocatellia bacterium]